MSSTIDVRKHVNSLIGQIYDGVLAPEGFQGFVEALKEAFALKAATMFIRHKLTQEAKSLWTCGIEMHWLESYALKYASEDLLALHIVDSPIASFYASNLDIPNPEQFPKSRFYREWIVPQGVSCAAAATVLREGEWLTQMWLQRATDRSMFTQEEMDDLNLMIPHLQRAIQMRQRFSELKAGQFFLAGCLNMLAMPTLLVDEFSRVVYKNLSADALVKSSDHVWLENDHLMTNHAETTRRLNLEVTNAIRASLGSGTVVSGVVRLPRDGAMPLMLMVAPMPQTQDARKQGSALLFVFDPELAPTVAAKLVQQIFGLSDTEAELASALCCGKTVDDFGKDRGTSINTTRTQLRSIFGKTGTNRQADLVSLLLSSPAYFLARPGT